MMHLGIKLTCLAIIAGLVQPSLCRSSSSDESKSRRNGDKKSYPTGKQYHSHTTHTHFAPHPLPIVLPSVKEGFVSCFGRFSCGQPDRWTPPKCIHHTKICNREKDCFNGVDELNCPPKCSSRGMMNCDDKKTCAKMCNGHMECPTGEDEKWCPHGCMCKAGEYQCQSGNKCISRDKLCNGHHDCDDYDDENDCPEEAVCKSGEFQCEDKTCITNKQICNNEKDCKWNEDEEECPTGCKCEPGQYLCKDGSKCIDKAQLCDLMNDCPDEDDESITCKTLITTTLGQVTPDG